MNRAFIFETLKRVAPYAMEWTCILFPLTVYLLYLAMRVHARRSPLLMTGKHNALQLILASSGVLLLGPPTWMLAWLFRYGWMAYGIGYGIYLFWIIYLTWLFIQKQSRQYVIMRVPPQCVQPLFEKVTQSLARTFNMENKQIRWPEADLTLTVDVRPFWHTVQLRFQGSGQMVEKECIEAIHAELLQIDDPSLLAHYVLTLWGGLFLLFHVMSVVLFTWYLNVIQ